MTQISDPLWLAEASSKLTRLTGLSFESSIETLEAGSFPAFRPTDLEYPNAFSLAVAQTPGRLSVSFVPDTFSRDLISSMGSFDELQLDCWKIMVASLESHKFSAFISVDKGPFVSANSIESGSWQSFELEVFGSTLGLPEPQTNELTMQLLLDTVALLLCILPVEETEEDDADWDEEGALSRVSVNKYERSRRNRQLCISLFGYTCQICEFDFLNQYGDLGRGYVEVHHITPVSLMGGPYKLNPREDLIPICSNCHRMLHRKTPPYTPTELKQILAKNRASVSPVL